MAEISVVGSINMDLVAVTPRLPSEGETVFGSRFFNAFGGKGANQAYAAARLGGNVAMFGRVGDDHHGEFMRANLNAAGCDASMVRSVAGASGVALIFVAESGQNEIVVVPGANKAFTASEFDQDSERLAYSRYVLLQLESPIETVIAAAKAARRYGAKVILDPAPALPALPQDLLAHVDILTPNETEAAMLAGYSHGPLSADDAKMIVTLLRKLGPACVILKMGARGCVLAEGNSVTHIQAPAVQAVDTTAAGDVFNAALAVALTENKSIAEACAFACRAAALSVTRFGAQSSMPDRADVDEFGANVPGFDSGI